MGKCGQVVTVKWYEKIPHTVLYIGFVLALGLFVYCFPRLANVIGWIFENGLLVFFIVVALLCIANIFIENKKPRH